MSAPKSSSPRALGLLTVGAIGVVYGDIGTSPLYAFRETFEAHHLDVTQSNVIGACSLVFWALVIIVSIKYLLYVLRADNKGEGGILALTSLISPRRGTVILGRLKWFVLLGLFGTALLYGDGVITPAISVLSAVEGLKVVQPGLSSYVLPIAVAILVGLFAIQKRGTHSVGRIFGPIMIIWFVVIGALGLFQAIGTPEVLRAINPVFGMQFLLNNGLAGFLSLGSIFLVVTGGEALYADLGHFGKRPIRLGWFAVAMPCLMLNYFGQSALLIKNPEAIESPFFLLGPEWARPILVGLATCAAIIASQALISGAFSMTVQAVQLEYLPRLSVSHTSADAEGQVYVPLVNWLLMIGSITLVLGFQTSGGLAAAYGIAVTGTMGVTTLLMAVFARKTWHWKLPKILLVTLPLLAIDLSFFLANVAKIPEGGWIPLVVGAIILTFMTTWSTGRRLLAERIHRGEVSMEDFMRDLEPSVKRVAGTSVFLFRGEGAAPPALITNVRHNHVLHERVILLSVLTSDSPYVPIEQRGSIEQIGSGVCQVTLNYGFMEEPDVDAGLLTVASEELGIDANSLTYFLGRETVISTPLKGMASWRERLFAMQMRTSAGAARFFRLPPDRVVEVGSQVEI
ncbi:MAG: potassium transporter Kup [Microthrixaceae bacterium]